MRPINHPAARATVVNYRTPQYWARTRWGDEKRKPVLMPIVLEPAWGVVAWVDETPCKSATLMQAKALERNWTARLSVSHFLDVPPVSGKYKGQWVEKRSVALRLVREDVRAYGIWLCDVAADSWAYHDGGELAGGRIRTLDAEDLTGLILGTPAEEIAARKRERANDRAIKKILKQAEAAKGLTPQVP